MQYLLSDREYDVKMTIFQKKITRIVRQKFNLGNAGATFSVAKIKFKYALYL